MNRGMDHGRMLDLISENGPIRRFKSEVKAYFDALKSEYPRKVEMAYGGDAAELFNQKLIETAKKMDDLLNTILDECTKIAAGKNEEYIEQERKMQNSME